MRSKITMHTAESRPIILRQGDVLLETVRPIGSNCVILEDGRVREIRTPAEQEAIA